MTKKAEKMFQEVPSGIDNCVSEIFTLYSDIYSHYIDLYLFTMTSVVCC